MPSHVPIDLPPEFAVQEGAFEKGGGDQRLIKIPNIKRHRAVLWKRFDGIRKRQGERKLLVPSRRVFIDILVVGYANLEVLAKTVKLEFHSHSRHTCRRDMIKAEAVDNDEWEDWIAQRAATTDTPKTMRIRVYIVRASIEASRIPSLSERLLRTDHKYTEYETIYAWRAARYAEIKSGQSKRSEHQILINEVLDEDAQVKLKESIVKLIGTEPTVSPLGNRDTLVSLPATDKEAEMVASRLAGAETVEAVPDYAAVGSSIATPVPGPAPPPPQAMGEVAICILDYGANAANPVLSDVLRDSENFSASPDTSDPRNHGSSVAGQAAYFQGLTTGIAPPLIHPVLAAKIRCKDIPKDKPFSELLNLAAKKWPGTTIFNISLNSNSPDTRQTYSTEEFGIDTWLANDEMAFVSISTGNWQGDFSLHPQQHQEPSQHAAWVCSPGRCCNATTVGSVALAAPVAGQLAPQGHPSPFTRHGVLGVVPSKPDFVHDGGNLVTSANGFNDSSPASPRLLHGQTSNKQRSHEVNFHRTAGTSYASPLIASLAAHLRNINPKWTGNTLRALLADASKLPGPPTACVPELVGFGVPSSDLIWSGRGDRVVTVFQGRALVDEETLIDLPIPPEFCKTGSERTLSVTLAYNPPVSHIQNGPPPKVNLWAAMVNGKGERLDHDSHQRWDKKWPHTLRRAEYRFKPTEAIADGGKWQLRVRSQRVGMNGADIPATHRQPFSAVVSFEARGLQALQQLVREQVRLRSKLKVKA